MKDTPSLSDASAKGAGIDWQRELSQHRRWLRTVILARVGEPQAVDEVMQEVSLAVVQGRSQPADASKVAPWLYRVAVTQSLLYRRKAGRRRKLVDRYAERVAPVQPSETDPLEWLLADERRQFVRKALGELHRRDREILLLKYTEDWSYKQLAEHMGISTSAVEARLHRARKRMRDKLAALESAEVTS